MTWSPIGKRQLISLSQCFESQVGKTKATIISMKSASEARVQEVRFHCRLHLEVTRRYRPLRGRASATGGFNCLLKQVKKETSANGVSLNLFRSRAYSSTRTTAQLHQPLVNLFRLGTFASNISTFGITCLGWDS